MGDNYQNFITEVLDELGKGCVEMSNLQSKIHSDYDSAESNADSDLEDGELRKMLASPLYVHGRGEQYGSSRKPTASGKPEAKIIQKRGASAQRIQADLSERESLKSKSSQATSVWETWCVVFIKERRTGKPVRKFYVQICWSVKIGRISSWR